MEEYSWNADVPGKTLEAREKIISGQHERKAGGNELIY